MSDRFRIKPLSEGLGLGSLRTPAPRFNKDLPPIEIHAQTQAHQVYRQQSVGTSIKKAPKARMIKWFAEALVGWGLDAVMVAVTLGMCSILGIMAWRLGVGTVKVLDPVDAVRLITAFVQSHGPVFVAAGFVCAWFIYWVFMRAVVGSTLGSSMRRSSTRSSH